MGTSPSCQDVDSQPFSLFLHELCQSLPDPATVTTCLVTILLIFKFFVSEIFFLRFPAQRPGLPTFRSYQSNVCASAYNGMPFHPSYIPSSNPCEDDEEEEYGLGLSTVMVMEW